MDAPLPPVAPEPVLSTQSAHPGRATWRTAVQTAIGAILTLGIALPIAAAIVNEQLGDYLPDDWEAWLITAGAFTAALSAAVARIMAIPQVDAWLEHIGLSSRPQRAPGRHEAV